MSFTLWKGPSVKSNDYRFFDKTISEMYRIGGTEFYIHKYLGPAINTDTSDPTQPAITTPDPLAISDLLNMEVRDRTYDPDVYSLKGHYQVSDTEFNLSQFGLMLTNDTIFITFHLNDMVNSIGRTLMSGDVIEICHRRDNLVLGSVDSVPKFFVVEEGARPAEGWAPSWWNHLWRVKCNPMTDSPEFQNILNQPATDVNGDVIQNGQGTGPTTLDDLISTYNTQISGGNAIVDEATLQVPFRYLEGFQFYVLSGDLGKPVTIWAGDGVPPNNSKPVASGITFPSDALIGDYFLRTDYMPNMLFRREASKIVKGAGIWIRTEINYRHPWTVTNKILDSFINNTNQTTLQDGSVIPENQPIRTVIKAKIDPDVTDSGLI